MQCIITSEVVKPFPDRPTNGQYSFEVVLSPMADGAFAKEVGPFCFCFRPFLFVLTACSLGAMKLSKCAV